MNSETKNAAAGSTMPNRRRLMTTVVLSAMVARVSAQTTHAETRKSMDSQNKRAVYQRYLSGWSAMTDTERAQAMRDATSAEVSYLDASAKFAGRDELAAHLAGFQKRRPNCSFAIGGFLQYRDVASINWHMLDPNGNVLVKGYDYVKFDSSGLLSAITGFSDVPGQRLEV